MPGIKTKQGLFFKATSLFSHELNIGGNFYNHFNLSLTLFLSKNIWYILLAHTGPKPSCIYIEYTKQKIWSLVWCQCKKDTHKPLQRPRQLSWELTRISYSHAWGMRLPMNPIVDQICLLRLKPSLMRWEDVNSKREFDSDECHCACWELLLHISLTWFLQTCSCYKSIPSLQKNCHKTGHILKFPEFWKILLVWKRLFG